MNKVGQHRVGLDGVGWDGMGWCGVGWDGVGWGGMGWDGMGWYTRVGWKSSQSDFVREVGHHQRSALSPHTSRAHKRSYLA